MGKRKLDPKALLRNLKRIQEHQYKENNKNSCLSTREGTANLREYLKLDTKVSGEYKHRDWELAVKFKTTIPSVQYFRRKRNLIERKLGVVSKAKLIELMQKSEVFLRYEL